MSSKTAGESVPLARAARRPWSLAVRLAAGFAVAGFLLILAALAFPYVALQGNLDREDNESLADKAAAVQDLIRKDSADAAKLGEELRRESEPQFSEPVFTRVMSADGAVIAESRGMRDVLPASMFPPPVQLRGEAESFTDLRLADGRAFRMLSAKVDGGSAAKSTFTLQVALDRSAEDRLLARNRHDLLAVLAIALVACAVAGYAIAGRGLKPVARMAAAVEHIGSSTLHERIDPAGLPAELSSLGAAFNDMLQRLQDSFDRLSRFSADIAHELRTPINNVRGLVEVSLGKERSPEERADLLGRCLDECRRLSRLIDNLLFLARAENPQTQIDRQSVDVGEELARVQEFYEPVAAEAGVVLKLAINGTVSAQLDRLLLQRAIGNLVENALAHTPAGGMIELGAEPRDGAVAISVADTGAGIPAEHLPHVFHRFHRVDASRSKNTGGVGLGLAIVRSVAQLHGGKAEVVSEFGRGSRFTLLLPSEPRNAEKMTRM